MGQPSIEVFQVIPIVSDYAVATVGDLFDELLQWAYTCGLAQSSGSRVLPISVVLIDMQTTMNMENLCS